MDAQGFMRPPLPPPPSSTPPPPPHMADPQSQQQQHHHHHHLQQQPPPQGNWFSGQFQFHASQPPPPPPQPQPQHWIPPPSNSYPPPPPPPQSLQQPNNNSNVNPYHHPSHPQQQPHSHYLPPPPPSHQQHPYSHAPPPPAYSQQTWENPNRVHQQSWQHPDGSSVNNNGEDWAARAKEWAAAKTATADNQHMQHQFAPIGRPEEHSHVYHDQLQQVDAHYADPQQPQHTSSNHQHYHVPSTNYNRPPGNHLQESTFNSGVSSSYVSDGHLAYMARDGAPSGDQNHVFSQGSASGNSSMYQQEVPSSYSSVPGAEGGGARNEQLHSSSHLQMQEGPHYMQQNFGAARSASMEQPHFVYGDRPTEPVATCDRPLEFTPTFSREHDPHPQPSYAHLDPTTSIVSGVVYPPIPPVPSGVQFDPSFGPPGPGHIAPMFGQITGSNFRPAVSGVNAQYGIGTGISVHPTTPFLGDANGGSIASDRPKKAPVPNWLREAIIKEKPAMGSSYQEYPEGDSTNFVEEQLSNKSFINGDQADKNSIGPSSLSDDEDEDDLRAAKTAAINQEIKRVLTEILLKVTDELFDEIATKVIDEDDVTVEADHSANLQKRMSSPPFQTTKASAKVLIPVKGEQTEIIDDSEKSSSGAAGDILGLGSYASKASAKILIPVKVKPTEAMDDGEKSSSGVAGDILGLGSYASDNDDDDEVTGSSTQPTSKAIQPSNLSDVKSEVFENDGSRAEPSEDQMHKESGNKRTSSSRPPVQSERDNVAPVRSALNGSSGVQEGFESKDVEEHDSKKTERPHGIVRKATMDDSIGRSSRSSKGHKDDEKKRISGEKVSVREADIAKTKADEKRSNSSREDERHVRKEKTDRRDMDDSKERARDRDTRTGEKAKEDARRDSNNNDERKETEKLKKPSVKEDSNRKRERDKDQKEDRSKHSRHRSDRNKRPRSSSISGRDRDDKDNSVGSHADESSDGGSEDSRKRKPRSKRRSTSPSPARSRRRQVSRSPRSKHSHRRHSPYSSLEVSRRRRSRSSSPVHHRRK